MTTPRIRSLVSFAGLLTVTLGLGACASAAPRSAKSESISAPVVSLAVPFDNFAHDYVHVYLVGERREWNLGRVEAGARTTLRVPREALTEAPGTMRLAVLVGQHRTLEAGGDGRATSTQELPTTQILSQRWTFSQSQTAGQLTGVWHGGARMQVAIP